MNPLTFATKKHTPPAHTCTPELVRERERRGNVEWWKRWNSSRKPSIIYYTGAYSTLWWWEFTMFIVRIVSFYRWSRFINVSAWVCVQKHLTLPLINQVKREQTANYSNFLHENYSSTNTHSFCIECCLKCVLHCTVVGDGFQRCDLSSI